MYVSIYNLVLAELAVLCSKLVVVKRANNCGALVSALCVLLKLQKGTETENEIETEKRIASISKSKSLVWRPVSVRRVGHRVKAQH